MEQGLIHIYCGDGKGKTSAAIGLVVRAAGSGLKVLFTRFLKNESSGELAILDDISQIKVLHLEKSYGFFKNLSEEKKQEVRETYLHLWRAIELEILTGRYDVLVIDEFGSSMHPMITRMLISLFNSKETNPMGSQLIFTTHDTNLLDNKFLRRDQIWFTEKDETASTDLYSLVEFKDASGVKVRNDRSYEKDYINGRYGAIPYL